MRPTLTTILILTACGPGGMPLPDGGMAADPMADALKASHLGPQVVAYDGTQLSSLLVLAVTAAYQQTGQVVTSGTVTFQSLDAATYSAAPAGRLVVVNPQGGKAEFTVRTMTSTQPANFFKGDWALDFHVVVANAFDLDLEGRSTGGHFTARGKGTITTDGRPAQIDVQSEGSAFFDNDSTGSEYRNQYRLTGTLSREGLTRTVDESWTFRMVTSRYNGKTSSASDAVRVDNGALSAYGDTVKWTNCRTAKAFTDGKPSQESFWSAKCDALTRNGQPFGQYRVDSQQFGKAGGAIRFLADLGGQTVELEKWNAY